MMAKPKTSPEFDRFNKLVGEVLSVPAEEIKRRREEDRSSPKSKKSKRKAKAAPAR
jgi:hypothetical protein